MVLGLGAWDCGKEFRLGFLVCYLTIEDEKKEKRGRRSLRDLKRFGSWKETSTVTF